MRFSQWLYGNHRDNQNICDNEAVTQKIKTHSLIPKTNIPYSNQTYQYLEQSNQRFKLNTKNPKKVEIVWLFMHKEKGKTEPRSSSTKMLEMYLYLSMKC